MKPIIFSTPMVQAILDGRKTQTRRVIKPNIIEKGTNWFWNPNENVNLAPYKPGDILWVRETWAKRIHSDNRYYYKADNNLGAIFNREDDKWRPSIHMPREAARIFLLVTNVRVERVQDITEEDAINEGVPWEYTLPESVTLEKFQKKVERYGFTDALDLIGGKFNYIAGFQRLWDQLHAKRGYGWDTNPWVWVVAFEKISKEKAFWPEEVKVG